MKARMIATAAIAAVLISSGAPRAVYGQTRPKPEAAAVVVASEARAVVESVDRQARQVLLHLPDDSLLTLTVPPEVKSIDQLKPGDHVAVRYLDARVIHLAKTNAASTEAPAPGTEANGEIQGVRTVVGVDPSRATVTLADAKNHIETLGVPDPSILKTLKPGDNVTVTYKQALIVSLNPV
jgi:Cu/Ag efflux protein CusF